MSVATLVPPPLSEVEFALEREWCYRSFARFVQRFWDIIEIGTPLSWGWHLQAVCDHLQAVDEGVFNKLIICIPPRFAKSTIVSCLWPAWTWLHRPYIRSLFGSYDEKLTFRDSIRCRDIIRSKLYQKMFNPDWQLRSDVNSMGHFSNTMHGSRKTYYIGSARKTGWGGNYVIVDDPLSAENRFDARIKADVIDTWEKVMSTRANRSRHYAFVIIMQRLADDDLVGFLIRKYGEQYVQLVLPIEFDPSRRCETPIFRDPRTEPGELLAPDYFSQSVVDDIKFTLGEVDFSAQYQHLPYPLTGNIFKLEYLQFWKFSDVSQIIELHYNNGKVELVHVNNLWRFLSADLAVGEDKTNDSTSIGHWGVTKAGELLLLYREKFRESAPKVIERLKGIYSIGHFGKTPPTRVCIEANGLGKPIAQHASAAMLPVEEIHVHKDKSSMSASAVTRMANGMIFLPSYETYPWVREMVEELLAFPGGAHDDDVSMISIASNSLFEVREGSPRSAVSSPNNKPRIDVNKLQCDMSKHGLFGSGNGNGNVIGNGIDYGRR